MTLVVILESDTPGVKREEPDKSFRAMVLYQWFFTIENMMLAYRNFYINSRVL